MSHAVISACGLFSARIAVLPPGAAQQSSIRASAASQLGYQLRSLVLYAQYPQAAPLSGKRRARVRKAPAVRDFPMRAAIGRRTQPHRYRRGL